MACTAIITPDGIDQIVEHQGNWKAIIKREVADLKKLDVGKVVTREFEHEGLAYAQFER